MSKAKKGKKNYIELESIFNIDKIYVFRADGVKFKDLRVLKVSSTHLNDISKVLEKVSIEIMQDYRFIRFAFICDDEINFAFFGKNIEKNDRIHKYLSLLTSSITVKFNRLINNSRYGKEININRDYEFDGRFIEIDNLANLEYYFLDQQKKSNMHFSDMLMREGFRWERGGMLKILDNQLREEDILDKYGVLAGCILSRDIHPIRLISTIKDFQNEIKSQLRLEFIDLDN